jgi:hypothetical protein
MRQMSIPSLQMQDNLIIQKLQEKYTIDKIRIHYKKFNYTEEQLTQIRDFLITLSDIHYEFYQQQSIEKESDHIYQSIDR